MKKKFTIAIILSLAALSLLLAELAYAQPVTKPPVPEFTLRYVDNSYDVPPTYGTDPYNGNTVMTDYGEHIDNRTIQIIIENQPFTTFNDSNGNVINRFYDVRYKGSYTETWTTMFGNQTQYTGLGGQTNPYMEFGYAVQDYSTQDTTIIYKLTWQVPTDGQIDLQVKALEGYTKLTSHEGRIYFATADFAFYGQSSDWGNTQTIKIGESAPKTTTAPTPQPPQQTSATTETITHAPIENPIVTPQQPNTESSEAFGYGLSLEQLAIIALSLLVVSLLIVIAVITKKRGA